LLLPCISSDDKTHLPTIAYFSVFITTRSDGNIYIEYHRWFFTKSHLVGGDTRKTRNTRDLANHAKPADKGVIHDNSTHSAHHAM
jgi:hypothetical protein